MALGGHDRTYAALRRHAPPGVSSSAPAAPNRPASRWKQLYEHASQRWLQSPDAYWTWRHGAIRSGRRLIRDRAIPLVYTTAPHDTPNEIGLALQPAAGRWVADFRDCMGYEARLCPPFPKAAIRQRELTEITLRRADAVTVASSAFELIFHDLYRDLPEDRIHFIPTGLDEAILDPTEPPQENTIVFSGEFLAEYSNSFFEMLAATVHSGKAGSVRLLMIGSVSINRSLVESRIRGLGLDAHIDFLDQLPQRELYTKLRASRACVLLSGRASRCGILYAKLVDYIALRKPVLTIVPEISEARKWLTRTGLGVFLDGSDAEGAETLAAFLSGTLPPKQPIVAECERFTAHRQAEAFSRLFEKTLG